MWLSGQSRRRRDRLGEAQAGFATIGGKDTGVYLDGERRAMAVYAPGGYQWTPAPGQEVLVLKNAGAGPAYCVTAARTEGEGTPGEVRISSGPGNAAVRLGNDGTVELVGRVLINGVPIESLFDGE